MEQQLNMLRLGFPAGMSGVKEDFQNRFNNHLNTNFNTNFDLTPKIPTSFSTNNTGFGTSTSFGSNFLKTPNLNVNFSPTPIGPSPIINTGVTPPKKTKYEKVKGYVDDGLKIFGNGVDIINKIKNPDYKLAFQTQDGRKIELLEEENMKLRELANSSQGNQETFKQMLEMFLTNHLNNSNPNNGAPPDPKKDKTLLYVGIGGGVLLLALLGIAMVKKS